MIYEYLGIFNTAIPAHGEYPDIHRNHICTQDISIQMYIQIYTFKCPHTPSHTFQYLRKFKAVMSPITKTQLSTEITQRNFNFTAFILMKHNSCVKIVFVAANRRK